MLISKINEFLSYKDKIQDHPTDYHTLKLSAVTPPDLPFTLNLTKEELNLLLHTLSHILREKAKQRRSELDETLDTLPGCPEPSPDPEPEP